MPESTAVNKMFASISGRYDLANWVMSCGMHRRWEKHLVDALLSFVEGPARGRALDLCTGTGALIPRLRPSFSDVVGTDFCGPMLTKARQVLGPFPQLVQGDAHTLPFDDNCFNAVTIAYGVRNFENLRRAFGEIRRVLAEGGYLAILEFGGKDAPLSWATRLYTRAVVPLLGGIVTGDFHAYRYLNKSSSSFPAGSDFLAILRDAGFRSLLSRPMFGGANIYICQKLS